MPHDFPCEPLYDPSVAPGYWDTCKCGCSAYGHCDAFKYGERMLRSGMLAMSGLSFLNDTDYMEWETRVKMAFAELALLLFWWLPCS
jgi:hypothetical protein